MQPDSAEGEASVYVPQQTQCFYCKATALVPRFLFSLEGLPHGAPGHNVTYAADCLSVCSSCGHGLLEHYSHDCWSYDDPWDMWWWLVVDPASIAVISRWSAACPTPMQPGCRCPAHTQANPLQGLSWTQVYRDGARELAGRARAHLDGSKLSMSNVGEDIVEMSPLPAHPPTPPREVTYYLASALPLKRLVTASGGLMVLKMSWKTGTFEHGLEYLHNIQRSHETEQVTEEEFIARVETHRATLTHTDGALQSLYTLSRHTTDPQLLRELQRRTYTLFQQAHPDPSFP
jgi:hypothetical protein